MRLRSRVTLALLPLLIVSCRDATVPRTGSLSVAIDGLPAGVVSGVIVTGPDGYRAALDASRTLSSLAHGTYAIVASDVNTNGTRFAAAPASQVAIVGGDAVATASPITYAITRVPLAVNVLGLPTGATASVTVSGPGGFTRVLSATTQIDVLEPGTYTIVAGDVQAAGITYRPAPRTHNVLLTVSATPASTTVAYGAGTGVLAVTIAGLPAGVAGSITVTGPGGFSQRLASSTTLNDLESGVYTVAASLVGSALTTYRPVQASFTSSVTNGSTSTIVVTYGGAPLELSLQVVAEGLIQPVFLTAPAGDARQFIVERIGRIRVVVNGVLKTTPFLDITARVNNVGERGALSMTFDPGYASNGYFYVYYIDANGDIALERFASTPGNDVASGSAGLVMSIRHRGSEHHGGLIAFGPDGMLYLAPGDGRCCGDPDNNAQNLTTLLGKVLRIDVRTLPYTIPAGNPFGGATGRAEIWAYGLRSPWRFSFDAVGGMLYLGDVGQDAREEVNAVLSTTAGLNYGWPYMEGSACYAPSSNCSVGRTLTGPVYDYPHSEGCSVIGGQVYRGAAIPELTGHYLFSDFCRGWLRSFRFDAGAVTDMRTWSGINLARVVSLGSDATGEAYVIAGTQVWRLVRKE